MELHVNILKHEKWSKGQMLYNILLLKVKNLAPGTLKDGLNSVGATGQLSRTKLDPSCSFYVGKKNQPTKYSSKNIFKK